MYESPIISFWVNGTLIKIRRFAPKILMGFKLESAKRSKENKVFVNTVNKVDMVKRALTYQSVQHTAYSSCHGDEYLRFSHSSELRFEALCKQLVFLAKCATIR